MRVALVHDFLTQMGGAERVVLEFSRMFPDAPIYTSVYADSATYPDFRNREVRSSFLQGHVDPTKFRRYAPLYPIAFSRLDLSEFDVVIASSSAFAHHVRHNNCYVYSHTPPRYLYSPERYDLTPRSQLALSLLRRPFVRLDRRAARAKRAYASNSLATSKRIRDLYGLTAPVIYPPLSTGHLPRDIKTLPAQPQLLMVSRLLPYKGVDIAIEAANLLHIPLTIIGDGPEMARLKSLAGPTVTLEGRVSDAVLADLFQESSAVLVPGVEDFGYGPIEAHWAGRPVIAFAAGGALETVHEGLNGLLVDSKDPSAWESAIEKALGFAWDPEAIRESTAPYRVDRFEAAVHEWLSPAASSEG